LLAGRWPCERQSRADPIERRSATPSGVNASLVAVGGKSIQPATEVGVDLEEGLVEDVENSHIRLPTRKPKSRFVVAPEALGKWLTAPRWVEYAADIDAVDVRGFDTESDDTARIDIHDDHQPEALQDDGPVTAPWVRIARGPERMRSGARSHGPDRRQLRRSFNSPWTRGTGSRP
jgi:hypothetical protein